MSGVGGAVVRVAGAHAVAGAVRHGLHPLDAASQVALLALDKQGRAGAFALQPGFTYAVTDAAGQTRIARAGSLFEAP